MNMADKQAFEEALRECAGERIHQFGHVQPHGATLVFGADAWRFVQQVSENLGDFLDIPSGRAIGQPLSAVLGEPGTTQVMDLTRTAHAKQTAAGVLDAVLNGKPIRLQAHVYATGGHWALEIEHDEGTHQENHLAQLQLKFQRTLLEFDSDADETQYFDEIAKLVRRLTDYDSVMVYRFNDRWDGEIIAQDKAAWAPSFLGHHFPASDIPPQARRLYALNLVRVVADIDAAPIPVVPVLNKATGEPLDMTYSALRSLSPIHLEYLRNMGVSASMVISIMQDGQLWGMIACHHMTPKRVAIAVRESAIFISRMISAKLSGIAALAQRAKMDQANTLVNGLVKSIATDDEPATMHKLLPRLMQVVGATGLIVVVDGQPHSHGAVPDAADVGAMLHWLGEKSTVGEIFSTDELGKQFEPAQKYVDVASGLLTTALTRDMNGVIVWLRKEKQRTVNWAGDYQSGLTQNAAGDFRLTPRKSFEIWCETWRGRSEPWSRADTGIAAMLSLSVPDALNQKHRLQIEQARISQAHQVSEKSVRQFNKLTGAIPGVVYQLLLDSDGNWKFLYLSAHLREILEVSPEEVYLDSRVMTDLIVPEHRAAHLASIQNAQRSLSPWIHDYVIETRGGVRKWVHGQALPEVQADGIVLWHGILTDVTERKAIDAALEESERKFRLLAENTTDGITIFDKHRNIEYVSPSVVEQLGYPQQEELGRTSADVYALLHPESRDAVFQMLNEAIEKKIPALTYAYQVKHHSGHYIWREDSTNFRYTAAGEYNGAYVVSRDITERKRLEEAVHQLAYFDSLTKLPNRRLLNDRLCQVMAASKRSGRYAAVMILDLDNFKPLNDQHGHLAGDLLLVEAASRLLLCVRDMDTVARFGGDEFVVMLSELDGDARDSHRRARMVAEKIRSALAKPYVLTLRQDDQTAVTVEHHCTASIGVALFVNHETAQEDILKCADAAMYRAKDAGRNAIRFYEAGDEE
jgi:diguanylate cyclase (GGDEF)-like protein/PAS domain S-box-containing protein